MCRHELVITLQRGMEFGAIDDHAGVPLIAYLLECRPGAAFQRLGVIATELIGVGNETRTSGDVMINAHYLHPHERRFATQILREYIDARIDLAKQDTRPAITQRCSVRQDQIAHRAFEREPVVMLQSEDRNGQSFADVRKVNLSRIGVVEVVGLAMPYSPRRHCSIDQLRCVPRRQ